MGALLTGIAVVGPLVAYAGITVVYPQSTNTVDVASPPITFAAGADHASAQTLGFAGAFTATNNAASYTLTMSGISGGTLTIDKIVTITKNGGVTNFEMVISTALSGTLTNPDSLKMRFWTGATPPAADIDAQCGVLDLEAAANTETNVDCTGATVYVQLVYQLPSASSGSSTVSIKPIDIVFA